MTICDKIQTVGETLESNLNARGVSCTFGTGTGEKNILQMTNLITSSNLKGSADSIISISASRPYLLSGEKTDLIVKLTNGLGEPKANASVTISDGTSSYSGITNNDGMFTVFDVTVTEDTTFTATYSSVSDSVVVEYCAFVDYAVTNMKNTDWGNSSDRITVTTNDSGTTLVNNSSGNANYTANYTFSNAIIEFDVLSSANGVRLYANNSGTGQDLLDLQTYNITNGHIKVLINNSVAKVYHNGTQQGSDISITVGSTMKFAFRLLSGTPSKTITYKNFRIRAL